MSDIAKRLRDRHIDTYPIQIGHGDLINVDGPEAAAEIERLREELDIWKSVFPDIAPERVQPDRSLLEAEIERLRGALEAVRVIASQYSGRDMTRIEDIARETLDDD